LPTDTPVPPFRPDTGMLVDKRLRRCELLSRTHRRGRPGHLTDMNEQAVQDGLHPQRRIIQHTGIQTASTCALLQEARPLARDLSL
jgi:hypothetical protein